MATAESLPRAVRRRAREQITHEIVEAARRHLATDGAPGLSLRAVARELGMASSAVYRYVAGRDELLTLLIVDAYDALGSAVEDAESRVPRDDVVGRWQAVCHGVRDWALAHPHEYALIYGSPVPGYAAPETTVGPATRVTRLMTGVLADAVAVASIPSALDADAPHADAPHADAPHADAPDAPNGTEGEPWRRALRPTRPFVPPVVPDEALLKGLMAWTYLFGAVSFELFGHRQHVIDDDLGLRRAFFTEEASRIGALAGLVPSTGA